MSGSRQLESRAIDGDDDISFSGQFIETLAPPNGASCESFRRRRCCHSGSNLSVVVVAEATALQADSQVDKSSISGQMRLIKLAGSTVAASAQL